MKNISILLSLILLLSCKKNNDLFAYLETYPVKAELLYPNNNSECTEGVPISPLISEINFSWNESINTDSYTLTITNLINKTKQVISTENTNIKFNLQRGIPYSWSVESTSTTSTKTAKSDIWYFYNPSEVLVSFIPFPALNNSPSLGATISQNKVNLNWTANDLDNDIIEYDVYFGSSANPDLFQSKVSDNFIYNIDISSDTVYYWKIVTRDLIGNESISNTFYFSSD
jgi:hypothetical protein